MIALAIKIMVGGVLLLVRDVLGSVLVDAVSLASGCELLCVDFLRLARLSGLLWLIGLLAVKRVKWKNLLMLFLIGRWIRSVL